MPKTRSDDGDVGGKLPCKLPRWKADMLAEQNYARAFNAGIEAAAAIVRPCSDGDEDTDKDTKEGRLRARIKSAVLALRVKYYPDAVERMFRMRNSLAAKTKRTAREDARLKSLREKIERLPTGHSPHDQEMIDLIHNAAVILRRKR